MHPEIQERVFDEIQLINGVDEDREKMHDGNCDRTSDDNQINYDFEKLSQMHFIERVLKESMRLFPIGPSIVREATDNVKITDCTIPKGAWPIISIYHMHRDPKYWGDDADLFRPDRFLPDRMSGRSPYCYLPFGAGPRNCIGSKYAMISMKIMLAQMVNRYRFRTNLKYHELQLKFELLLKLSNNFSIQVERR